jgi:hypothetical protein
MTDRRKVNELRTRGGAAMLHARITRKTDVRAEAESSATNLSASALSTPRVWSEQWQG